MLVAGRAIFSTHEAAGSTRNQPACMVTGRAAGVAPALAVRERVVPRQVDIPTPQADLRAMGRKLRLAEVIS